MNGRNVDPDGSVRTAHRRTLNLTKAIAENIESRVWLGVHWRFDGEGLPLAQGGLPLGGRAIGEYLAPKIRECFSPPPPAEETKQEEKTV
ncbi:hypothetical protein [Methylorubrum sp. SB2]|uniref:hypothetical protein n=1 Tax=Methylorubrum subtropicum TaxID=3138812 RepID=UPI00313B4A78